MGSRGDRGGVLARATWVGLGWGLFAAPAFACLNAMEEGELSLGPQESGVAFLVQVVLAAIYASGRKPWLVTVASMLVGVYALLAGLGGSGPIHFHSAFVLTTWIATLLTPVGLILLRLRQVRRQRLAAAHA